MASIAEALNLAVGHHQAGRLGQAEQIYREILRADPRQADALHLLGLIAYQSGNNDAAIELIGPALAIRPNTAAYHNSLGAALAARGQYDDAATHYRRALEIKPNYAEAHNNLGMALLDKGRLDEAITHYRTALDLNAAYADAHFNLGCALERQGDAAGAIACYERSLEITPNKIVRYSLATVLPVIYESVQEMDRFRNRMLTEVAALDQAGLQYDPVKEKLPHTFHLAYQGRNDREILQTLGRICADSSVDLTRPETRPAGSKDRIRVGFISSCFGAHTVSKVWRGVIARLSSDQFLVTVLSLDPPDDPIARLIQGRAERFVSLPRDLKAARQRIADEALDILYYLDIGMNPATYALAVSRLAPVQCVTWGHPDTTGLANIDYFISSELLETDDADDHYTEQLVRLKTLGTYYDRPQFPPPAKKCGDFGLPDDKHLYACPQSLFKFDPEFDLILAEILRRDPQGVLILNSGMCPQWDRLLTDRFARTLPDVAEQIQWVPRLNYNDYLRFINLLDVLLVPPLFGAGSTSYEALAFGIPVVTLPSAFLRGRITYALYRQMEVYDVVAETPQQYVEIAVRLGTDPAFRATVREKILAASDRLFEDIESVRELERVFQQLVER